MKNIKKVLYIIIVILVAIVTFCCGLLLNVNARNSLIKQTEEVAKQATETSSSNGYITTAEHLKEMSQAKDVCELYYYGNECTDITGGWKFSVQSHNQIYTSSNITWINGNGNYTSGSYTLNSDNVYMNAKHGSKNNGYGFTAVTMTTNNLIDFSQYKYICINAQMVGSRQNGSVTIEVVDEKENEISIETFRGTQSIMYYNEINITEKGYLEFIVGSSSTEDENTSINIYSVFLIK